MANYISSAMNEYSGLDLDDMAKVDAKASRVLKEINPYLSNFYAA
jgi:hypothetical protein